MHFTQKLAVLLKQERALQLQKEKLIEKRKKEIMQLIEKHDLLLISNAVFEGLFLRLKDMMQHQDPQLVAWENEFHRGSAKRRATQAHHHSTSSIKSTI